MKFKEFRESPLFREHGRWYILTTEDGQVYVLQWEPSNQRWYKPEPLEGREEFGCLDIVCQNSRILHIRPI